MKGISSTRILNLLFCAAFLFLLALVADARPAGFLLLREATLQAFSKYVTNAEVQNSDSLRDGPFLWIDGLSERDRATAIARLKSGEVEMRRLGTAGTNGTLDVPSGLIHDWEGIVFIPRAKLDDVLKALQDYDHHAVYYAPDVASSHIESRDGGHFRVFMRFRRQKIVTVVLDTDQDVNYYRDSPTRAHSRSSAIRIAQVEDPDGSHEKEKTPGDDDGYLWRMETWWRMEERDGGVYVQNRVITLTRDIPTGLAWLIEPFISSIPKETLEFTLRATRSAVLNHPKS